MTTSSLQSEKLPDSVANGKAPLVTVVIPARDAQPTLGAALDSLLAQTHAGWRAVVVDDGSRDGTAALVAAYAKRDGRISGLSGAGKGASAARNLGLAAAQGRWVLFLDADDWIDPRFLERMLAALRDRPRAVAAYCGSRRVAEDGRAGHVVNDANLAAKPRSTTARYNPVAIHAVLVDREAVLAVGGFDASLKTCEEWDLWQRLGRLDRPWVQASETMAFYRTRSGSLSKDLPQLLADAEIVVRRGFGRDERVAGAAGARTDALDPAEGRADDALAGVTLWFGTVEVLRGGDGGPALRLLEKLPSTAASTAADAVADAVAIATHLEPSDLAGRWPEYGPALTGWLEQVGSAWSDPVLARRLRYQVERRILARAKPSQRATLGITLGAPLDPAGKGLIEVPGGVDRLFMRMPRRGGAGLDFGALGDVSQAELLRAFLSRGGLARTLRLAASSLSPGPLLRTPVALAAAAARNPRQAMGRTGFKRLVKEASVQALDDAAERRRPPSGHAAELAALAREAEAVAAEAQDVRPPAVRRGVDWSSVRSDGGRETYWDDVFRNEDPWNYASPYEQEKYDRQVDILPEGRVGVALELACAEGRFTKRLAGRAERVIATDISRKALERAQARCSGLTNVTFQQLDLIDDPLPQDLDLIVCSEVLYFLHTPENLAKTVRRFVAALKPGGRIVTAHFFLLKDDPSRTGFDFAGHPYGAETIARVFREVPGLTLERRMDTELYRIDRYVRTDDAQRPEPAVERLTVEAPLDPEVRRSVVWGGAVVTREQAQGERRGRIPVLMYHRIAEDGPESLRNYRVAPDRFREQVRWLRRNGYHTVPSDQLPRLLDRRWVGGRPVVITFDDGFQDFADVAWPALHDHDLTPEVFVPTDLVGRTSEWDARAGGAFPLMDKRTLGRLRNEGVIFGSHLASHRAADGLPTRELAQELLRSRALLGKWLGTTPTSFAAPFGATDERLQWLAAECGYTVGFGTRFGCAALGSDPLNLPRIEVGGDWTMDRFVAELESHL
jgi:peptidoglycan/xylan/chitin deacetylase (PgdA/CDA1 family)/2-polyprenyl-3-methyl-5-hydroxy-6-metoxy-1,4-benzoquinol methylase